jgi:PAS domain S-box-containing protein
MSKDCVRVLLVEDSPSDARLLCEALQDYPLQKFEIERAERLDEAIALLAQKPFDVVLLDLNLPDSRGMETCRRMSPAAGQASIIILTGAEDEAIAAEAMCLGVQDYLVKGQAYGSVIGRTIRYTVERSQAQEALREANERLQEQAEELATVNATLRESEERLHLAMEAGKVGIWEWQVGTERVEWSQGVYALLGYRFGEVTPANRALRQRIHPQDLARHDHAQKESLERCEDYLCEFRVVWADGSVHWIEARGQYAYVDNETGTILRMRGVFSDIDTRKQAEEALRQSERRFKSTFENAAIGIAHVALDEHLLQFNSRFCEIAGYLPDDIIGKTCEQITFANDWKAERVQMQRLLDGQVEHYSIEKRYVRLDGSFVWVNLTRSIQRDDAGRPEHFIVLVEDISERERVEEALRQSEEQLRVAATAAEIGMWHWTPGTSNVVVTANWRRLFGVSEDATVTFETWRNALHPEDREPAVRELNAAAAEHREFNVEYRIVRPDGTLRWIVDRGRASYDASGRPIHMAGVNVDITARKQAEEALRGWNTTLESNVAQRTAELLHRTRQLQKLTLELSETEDRERKRLAEILHDDLQQVLASAKFQLSLMRNQVRHDASLQALAAQIDHMLKDAIEKSRSLSHELSPAVLYHGDFAETLRWLAGQMQAKHGLVVHVQAHGQVHLQSDAIKAFLYKTAQELLFNAVKHAGVKEAQIRVRRCGPCFCVSVSDRGRGFDPQLLREAAGFGLLNIRERIELLGGRMKIKSAPGRGSTFSIVVPDRIEAQDAVEVGRVPKRDLSRWGSPPRAYPTSGGPEGPPLRVLLADDHEIVRQGLAALLSDEDAVEIVGEAANGREAVDLADQLHPDVVIMDMSMPVMGGDEATRRIKSQSPQTRVVALSMFEDAEVRDKMFQAGAESYVLKTAPSEELLAAVRGRSSETVL